MTWVKMASGLHFCHQFSPFTYGHHWRGDEMGLKSAKRAGLCSR
jgi:hypothetical protein